jgi:hypothetical protein
MGPRIGKTECGGRQAEPNAALGWAEIAGLVAIQPDGSWRLTLLGTLRMRELQALDRQSGIGKAAPQTVSATPAAPAVTEGRS